MQAQICPNCGFSNRPGARFCGRCGFALSAAAPPAYPAAPWEAPPVQRASRGGSLAQTGAGALGLAALVVFVLLFSLAFPVFVISGKLSDPDTYISALQDEGAYEQFPELFGDQADYWVHGLQSSFFLLEMFFRNITRDDWTLIAERILTPEWVQAQTEGLIEQFFDYANGETETLSLNVSFREVKERLGGEVGYQTYTEITAGKPECNMLEMTQWLLAPTIGLLPVCKLPADANLFGLSAPDPAKVVPGVLADWAATLPDQSNWAAELTPDAIDEIDSTFGSLRAARIVAGAFMFIALAFLGFSLISPGVRALKGFLRMWSIALLVCGVLLALMAVFSAAFLIWQVNDLFAGLTDVFVAGALDLGKAVGQHITLGLATPVGALGGALTVIGFGMFAASFFVGGGDGGRRGARY